MNYSRSAKLSDLVNIGSLTEKLLCEIGISTPQQLQVIGPAQAWRLIKARHPERATLSLLYDLQGALLGIPGKVVPVAIKGKLFDQFINDR